MPEDESKKRRPAEWRDILAPEVLKRYAGQHIAVINKQVVVSGATYAEVVEAAEKLYPDEMPYIAFIRPLPASE